LTQIIMISFPAWAAPFSQRVLYFSKLIVKDL
jgi:hypothetical protein